MDWPLLVSLDRDSPVALFTQLAGALADAIRSGRLGPGDPLPGSRTLALTLGVHRNTAVAAYRELEAQGWIEVSGQTTRVAVRLPPGHRRGEAPRLALRTGFAVRRASSRRLERPEVAFDLGGWLPDPRLAPRRELARAVGRTLRDPHSRALEYGDSQGHPRLREQIARMLVHTRGLAIEADDVLVTRGSQMALALVAQALIQPGDEVAVEQLGYAPAWDAFEHAGGSLRAVAVDARGLSVDPLIETAPPRAVYITPHHQYPTTVTLDAGRRLRLLDWASRHRVALIEDDYDAEYHYDTQPVHPLAALDRHGVVIYVGTLSKVLAPGLRIGWVVAPHNLIGAMTRLRAAFDGQGSLPMEAAVAEMLEDREVQRHIWRSRRQYAERRDALAETLRVHLGGALDFETPPGGLALWARVLGRVSADAWARRALERGVRVSPGSRYTLDGGVSPHLRIGFARHSAEELVEAVKRLAGSRTPGASTRGSPKNAAGPRVVTTRRPPSG